MPGAGVHIPVISTGVGGRFIFSGSFRTAVQIPPGSGTSVAPSMVNVPAMV